MPPNQTVTISGQSYGQNAFVKLADVKTTAGGAWTYTARPTIRTVYRFDMGQARQHADHRRRPAAREHPRAVRQPVLDEGARGALVRGQIRPVAAPLGDGQWLTLKRVRLDSTSAATLKASLPMGNFDAALRVQREPGRRRVPRRVQPHARLSPRLSAPTRNHDGGRRAPRGGRRSLNRLDARKRSSASGKRVGRSRRLDGGRARRRTASVCCS